MSVGRRPNCTPRALAASRPFLVRSMIRERSNSAMPANTVSTMRPAGVVVSAHGSASERRPAPFACNCSAMSSRSRVLRASLSSRVTVTTSPARRWSSIRPSSGRLAWAPVIFSAKMRVQPAACSSARWFVKSWSSVDTLA
ncbi:hypothetical protein D9M70_522240 [compost metagenome]